MINAQLFYKDNTNIIYSLLNNEVGRYFLNIPVSEYNNFLLFLKFKKEDNTKKGTAEYTNQILIRKELLEESKKINEFIKALNSNMVYSRINHLKELPTKELEEALNENKPFNIEEYKEITKNIENIINENFKLITSYNIKKESIEQTILLISQKEKDEDFIEWLKKHLTTDYTNDNLEELRKKYDQQKIQLNIEEYKETENNNNKFIIGKNTNNEMYSVQIPSQYNMLQAFEIELKTYDKSKLINLDGKKVATILFDKIISDLPSEKMIKINDSTLNNNENKTEENIINNEIQNNENNYLVDQKNNIALNVTDNNAITVEKNEYGETVVHDAKVSTYEFDQNTKQPLQNETIIQTKAKKRVLIPSKYNENGFIKLSTILFFGLSFVLTIISLILLISS